MSEDFSFLPVDEEHWPHATCRNCGRACYRVMDPEDPAAFGTWDCMCRHPVPTGRIRYLPWRISDHAALEVLTS